MTGRPPRLPSRILPLGLALCASFLAAPLRAEPRGSLLFGPYVIEEKPPVVWDPSLPRGATIGSGPERPQAGAEPPACSFSEPVCVHRARSIPTHLARDALTAFERAYARLVRVLRFPAPLLDQGAGGSDALDLYLVSGTQSELLTGTEAVGPGDWDSVSGFCVLTRPEPAFLERAATQCVGEAIARRLDAAETPDLMRAYATLLWWISRGPEQPDLELIQQAQRRPEWSLAGRERSRQSDAHALLLEFLEREADEPGFGELATTLLSLSATKTPAAARQWHNEPDAFDVLRHTLSEKPSRVAELFGRLAVQRAFIGAADKVSYWPSLKSAGGLASIKYDWTVPWASLPRRLAPDHPLSPLGSMYVWLELKDVPLQATLGFQAEWESPAPMEWVLVRIGHQGQELSRVRVPFQESGQMVEQRLVELADAKAVLIVGTNLGGTDLAHPFDPDLEPFEPHGCTVFLAAL